MIKVFKQGKWLDTELLWQGLARAVPVFSDGWTDLTKAPLVVSFTGAGGKTSLIYRLAAEAAAAGRYVLIVTTTHMFEPQQYGVLGRDAAAIIARLAADGIVVAGVPDGQGKIGFIGQDCYDQVCPHADLVLVEADGSRRLPLKVFGPHEPVLPDNTDVVVCVAGLAALGQALDQVCFRLEAAHNLAAARGLALPPVVTPPVLAFLWQQGCMERLQGHLPVLPVLNQADTAGQIQQAREIFESLAVPMGLITACLDREPFR